MSNEETSLSFRAQQVLKIMRGKPSNHFYEYYGSSHYEDGHEWFRLAHIYNIGAKTICELLDAGLIDQKYEQPWFKNKLFKRGSVEAYYRLVENMDFGDLWIE